MFDVRDARSRHTHLPYCHDSPTRQLRVLDIASHLTNGVVGDSTTSPLEHLSRSITENALAVSQFLQENHLPRPSREADGPTAVLPSDSPESVQRARQQLIAASLEILQLAIRPSEFLPHLGTGFHYISCLAWLANYSIFHLVPQNKTISYADLATAAGVPEQRLKSILRMAMTTSLFREHPPSPDGTQVGHSATSAFLARDDDAYAYATYMCSRTAPMAMSLTAAHTRWGPASERTDQTAYNVAFDTHLPLFDDIAQDQARTDEFARYMRSVRSSEAVSLKHLVAGLDLRDVPEGGRLVDVGGSTGSAALALAKAYPHVSFTVQDLPANVESGRKAVAAQEESGSVPAAVASRLAFQAHDFLQPQPVQGADAYLLRMILHGLTMLQSFNSGERELDGWKKLIAAADPRLELVSANQPTGSAMSVLEIKLSVQQ